MEYIIKKQRIYRHAEIMIRYHYFKIIKAYKIKYLGKEVCKNNKNQIIKKNHYLHAAAVVYTLLIRMRQIIIKTKNYNSYIIQLETWLIILLKIILNLITTQSKLLFCNRKLL